MAGSVSGVDSSRQRIRLGDRRAHLATCLALGACAAALELARPSLRCLYDPAPKSSFDDLHEVDAHLSIEVPTATAGASAAPTGWPTTACTDQPVVNRRLVPLTSALGRLLAATRGDAGLGQEDRSASILDLPSKRSAALRPVRSTGYSTREAVRQRNKAAFQRLNRLEGVLSSASMLMQSAPW
jgi:hypothetical protein